MVSTDESGEAAEGHDGATERLRREAAGVGD
jgi:hypothetical protein